MRRYRRRHFKRYAFKLLLILMVVGIIASFAAILLQ